MKRQQHAHRACRRMHGYSHSAAIGICVSKYGGLCLVLWEEFVDEFLECSEHIRHVKPVCRPTLQMAAVSWMINPTTKHGAGGGKTGSSRRKTECIGQMPVAKRTNANMV